MKALHVLLALVVAALVPGAASSAPAASRPTLFTTPFTYKGYSWTMFAQDGAKDSLSIIATKRAGKATQSHIYSFQQGVTFSANASLSSAKLTARLGTFGTIVMTFAGKGGLATTAPPPPCKGAKFQSRSGTLSGRPGFSFRADTGFFGKLSKPSLGARLSRQSGAGKLNCGGGGPTVKPPSGGVSLFGTATGGGQLSVSVVKTAAGAVTQSVFLLESTAPATVAHSITVPAPSSTFTVADDLSSATVQGQRPFLSGTLKFQGQGFGNTAAGQLTGDFTAKFDSPGARKPAQGGMQGTLIRS